MLLASYVVPARAGVIRRPPLSMDVFEVVPARAGVIRWRRVPQAGRDVVPARAGVIRAIRAARTRATSRPRASGGHPFIMGAINPRLDRSSPRERGSSDLIFSRAAWRSRSSPRERGSSDSRTRLAEPDLVVPARAGVIRPGEVADMTNDVVPARAGVIRMRPDRGVDPGGSSPRDRGSSDLGLPVRGMNIVVPARAGVIRAEHDLGHPRDRRPRASGGHSLGFTGIAQGVGSSPRERRSSAVLPAEQHAAVVVPARAGVIRDSCGRGSNGLWLGSLIERTWQ